MRKATGVRGFHALCVAFRLLLLFVRRFVHRFLRRVPLCLFAAVACAYWFSVVCWPALRVANTALAGVCLRATLLVCERLTRYRAAGNACELHGRFSHSVPLRCLRRVPSLCPLSSARYEVLGLPTNKLAKAGEISKAYKTMSLMWHPDKHMGKDTEEEAHDKFMARKKGGIIKAARVNFLIPPSSTRKPHGVYV